MSVPYQTGVLDPIPFLKSKGFSEFTAKSFLSSATSQVAQRHFILDDSGSMGISDGKVWTPQGSRNCTRWEELRETVNFVANTAHLAQIPCRFHLLNATHAPLDIGFEPASSSNNLNFLLNRFTRSPEGGTPICGILRRVHSEIVQSLPYIPADKLIYIIICTDGVPSDGDIRSAMKLFAGMPQIRFVIRLMCDENQVLDFWGSIDKDMEAPIDVLDDVESEAKEIESVNKWLTYTEMLHYMRVFGFPFKLFDLLDETKLSPFQMEEFVKSIYGDIPTTPVYSVLKKKMILPVRSGKEGDCCIS